MNYEIITPQIRLTKIKELCQSDPEFIDRILTIFLSTTPSILAAIKEASEAREFDRVAKLAHRLKSSYYTFEIRELYDHLEILTNHKTETCKQALSQKSSELYELSTSMLQRVA